MLQSVNRTAELRKQVDILIIDDDEVFLQESYLQKNGFRITHKTDIDTIKDVSDYEVILCDIRGVGKKLGASKEGAFLIKEIRNNYPNKQIVAYTGSSYDAAYNQYLKYADAVIDKGIPLDDWVALLDKQIENAVDPRNQWDRIRRSLLDSGLDTIAVAQIEDRYVRSIKTKKQEEFRSYIGKIDNAKAREVLTEFLSSLCVKLLLGGIQ